MSAIGTENRAAIDSDPKAVLIADELDEILRQIETYEMRFREYELATLRIEAALRSIERRRAAREFGSAGNELIDLKRTMAELDGTFGKSEAQRAIESLSRDRAVEAIAGTATPAPETIANVPSSPLTGMDPADSGDERTATGPLAPSASSEVRVETQSDGEDEAAPRATDVGSAVRTLPPIVVPITELNSGAIDAYPWVSVDGRWIYWTREGSDTVPSEIWVAYRPSAYERFREAKRVLAGRQATLTADETEMVFLGTTGLESQRGLDVSRRSSAFHAFEESRPISELRREPVPKGPKLSANGSRLTFLRGASRDIVTYHRKSRSEPWGNPSSLVLSRALTGMRDAAITWPQLSEDGLTLFCCRERGREGSILYARRASVDQGFETFREAAVEGVPLEGRCPYFVPATNELFYCAPVGGEGRDWELRVVKNWTFW